MILLLICCLLKGKNNMGVAADPTNVMLDLANLSETDDSVREKLRSAIPLSRASIFGSRKQPSQVVGRLDCA